MSRSRPSPSTRSPLNRRRNTFSSRLSTLPSRPTRRRLRNNTRSRNTLLSLRRSLSILNRRSLRLSLHRPSPCMRRRNSTRRSSRNTLLSRLSNRRRSTRHKPRLNPRSTHRLRNSTLLRRLRRSLSLPLLPCPLPRRNRNRLRPRCLPNPSSRVSAHASPRCLPRS